MEEPALWNDRAIHRYGLIIPAIVIFFASLGWIHVIGVHLIPIRQIAIAAATIITWKLLQDAAVAFWNGVVRKSHERLDSRLSPLQEDILRGFVMVFVLSLVLIIPFLKELLIISTILIAFTTVLLYLLGPPEGALERLWRLVYVLASSLMISMGVLHYLEDTATSNVIIVSGLLVLAVLLALVWECAGPSSERTRI